MEETQNGIHETSKMTQEEALKEAFLTKHWLLGQPEVLLAKASCLDGMARATAKKINLKA